MQEIPAGNGMQRHYWWSDGMGLSEEEFRSIVQVLIKLSVQMDTSELENYKVFIDSINPSGDELLQKMKEEEYKQLEKGIQEAIDRLNKLI
jgi:predicted transcriptional regulator